MNRPGSFPPSGRDTLVRMLLVTAVCLGVARVAAQDPAGAQSRYGPRLEVASFAYHRQIPAGAAGLTELRLDAAVLAHARADFADLRVVSGDGRQVAYLIREEDQPLAIDLPALTKDSRGAVSRYAVRLPYAHLPAARLELTTTARVFQREVWLEADPAGYDDRRSDDHRVIADSWWSHADPETPAPPLAFDVPPLRTATLHVAVDEGDNSPLPLGRATLMLPAQVVRFVRPAAAPLLLVYGNREVDQPRYDLALVARRLLDSPAVPATIGPETPATPAPARAGILFWSALGLAVLVLLALIVRLLRSTARGVAS